MKVIIEVHPEEINWGKSKVHQFAERGPDDAIYWDVDVDIDQCYWSGMAIEFVDYDEAAQWFHESYKAPPEDPWPEDTGKDGWRLER